MKYCLLDEVSFKQHITFAHEFRYHLLDVNKIVAFINDQSDTLKKGQIVTSQRTTMANILNNQIKAITDFQIYRTFYQNTK